MSSFGYDVASNTGSQNSFPNFFSYIKVPLFATNIIGNVLLLM